MRWINGETILSKINREKQWHKWFAWYPVNIGKIEVGTKIHYIRAWLEPVYRRKKILHYKRTGNSGIKKGAEIIKKLQHLTKPVLSSFKHF